MPEPAPDADPASWLVNEPVIYRKYAACSARMVDSEMTRMTGPWTPRPRRASEDEPT